MDLDLTIKEMRESIGTKEPIVFFEKMVDVFNLLFNRIEQLQKDLNETRINAALAIQWEPKVARTMISDQITVLRESEDDYIDEISKLKKAFIEDKVTQNYNEFCIFWEDTLGFHPFLSYE